MFTYKKSFQLLKKIRLILSFCIVLIVGLFCVCLYNSKKQLNIFFDDALIYSFCCVVSKSNIDDVSFQNKHDSVFIDGNKFCEKRKNLFYKDIDIQKSIVNGNKIFIYLNIFNSKRDGLVNLLDKSDYIEFETLGKEIENFLAKVDAKKVFAENYLNKSICYFYLPQLKKYKIVNGYKVNLQLVYKNDLCKIGYPLIYGCY